MSESQSYLMMPPAAQEQFLVPIETVKRAAEVELLDPHYTLANEEQRLARLVEVSHALAEVKTMPEALEIRSKARALHVFMQQRQRSREMINDAVEIYLRASRRVGEILLTMDKNKGAATRSLHTCKLRRRAS